MKVLITGGAGSIGSNLTYKLLASGWDVYVADSLWRGRIENRTRGSRQFDLNDRFSKVDLTSFTECRKVTKGFDYVIHLADVVAGIDFVFGNELFVFRQNILINSHVLQASIENKVRKYLYVGTACSYPVGKQAVLGAPPLMENDVYPADPESSYGWSKLMGEYECQLAASEGRLEVCILRLHNVYGPPCDLSPDKSQVIPALCRKAIRYPEEDFVVWGTGSQRRAFVFVDDAVEAISLALQNEFNNGVIQIGPNESHSISWIAETVVRISGKEIPIRYDSSRPEGDRDRSADFSRARDLLDWVPTTSLEEGLRKTYDWARDSILET